MSSQPTYEELKKRIAALESRSIQATRAEDVAVWESLLSEQVVDDLPAGLALFNEDFVLLKCNRAYAEFLRIHTPYDVEQALGMCHFDYKPGSALYLADWFREVRDSGRSDTRYDMELCWMARDGKPHTSYWDAHLAPVDWPNGGRHGVLMCCMDVTECNLMKKALREKDPGRAADLRNLEELKSALRALLRLREEDKHVIEEKLLLNTKQMILPWLERLKRTRLSAEQKLYVDALEASLRKLVSPFSQKLSASHIGLTPMEIEVASLVHEGKRSKEIAELLGVSKECIDFHRNNIRKKLHLTGRKANLRTYLSAIVH